MLSVDNKPQSDFQLRTKLGEMKLHSSLEFKATKKLGMPFIPAAGFDLVLNSIQAL